MSPKYFFCPPTSQKCHPHQCHRQSRDILLAEKYLIISKVYYWSLQALKNHTAQVRDSWTDSYPVGQVPSTNLPGGLGSWIPDKENYCVNCRKLVNNNLGTKNKRRACKTLINTPNCCETFFRPRTPLGKIFCWRKNVTAYWWQKMSINVTSPTL